MSKQHTVWSIIFALVILLVLAVMPAQAQDIGGCNSDAEWMCYAHHVFLPGVTK